MYLAHMHLYSHPKEHFTYASANSTHFEQNGLMNYQTCQYDYPEYCPRYEWLKKQCQPSTASKTPCWYSVSTPPYTASKTPGWYTGSTPPCTASKTQARTAKHSVGTLHC